MLSFSFDVEIECKERMIVIYLNCFLHILMGWNKHLTYRSGKNGAFVIYYIVIYKRARNATPKDWVKGKGMDGMYHPHFCFFTGSTDTWNCGTFQECSLQGGMNSSYIQEWRFWRICRLLYSRLQTRHIRHS